GRDYLLPTVLTGFGAGARAFRPEAGDRAVCPDNDWMAVFTGPQGEWNRAMSTALNSSERKNMPVSDTTRIGAVGYGFIGQHVCQAIQNNPQWGLELAFVWNRSAGKLSGLPADLVLPDLAQFAERAPSLIVECAHPGITVQHGEAFLGIADYLPLSV